MANHRFEDSGNSLSARDRLKKSAAKLVQLRALGVKETDSRLISAKMEYDLARRDLIKQTKPVLPTITSAQIVKPSTISNSLGEVDRNFVAGAVVGVATALAAVYCWIKSS